MFTIEVGVLEKAQVILDYLNKAAPTEMSKYHNWKLIYPMGYLQTVDLQKSFYEL